MCTLESRQIFFETVNTCRLDQVGYGVQICTMKHALATTPDFISFADKPESAASRIVNSLAILGEATAAELVKETQLSRSSISSLLTELREANVVFEVRQERSGLGRPTVKLALNPKLGICAGVLLGHGEIHVGICDVTHQILSEEIFLVDPNYSAEEAALVVAQLLAKHCSTIGKDVLELIGVGLAISAPIGPKGRVVYSSILPSWAGKNIGELFAQQLPCPIHIENESNCAAFAEMMWGAARREPNFAMFKFDLGVGGAVVFDNNLLKGAGGLGGEFGHIPLDPTGPVCHCGNRGCLDSLVGGRHLLRLLRSSTGEETDLSSLTRRAAAGELIYRRILEDAAEVAGRALGVVSNIVNPPMILITGGLAQAGDVFLDPLRKSFDRHSLNSPARFPDEEAVRLVAGDFLENDNVLGAAALVLRQVARVA